MKGIIFVLHGRKDKISQANMELLEELGAELEQPYEIGLLEGDFQTLEEAINKIIAQNVEQIVFQPVLLFPATHVRDELPERINEMLQDPNQYSINQPLATAFAIKDYLVQQISDTHSDKDVLIIAHGTPHYVEPAEQLAEIIAYVNQRVPNNVFGANHLGKNLYQDFLATHPESMMILPLFLTEGFLTKKIQTAIIESRGQLDEFLPTLENQEALKQALRERLN